ncbi:MAG: helix-turn-helix domain-containing protein [Solirubrobacteraceae bacterium MAG38_C4-C5]|nr:helix-turn-helix domain-containing protein [Candidatus Siliceabacter maunaloa]
MSTMTTRYLDQAAVGHRIADLRAERGVSQRRLAAALDLDPSALSRIESGERGLAVGELVAAAAFLGVDTDAILRERVDLAPLFRNDGTAEEGEETVAQVNAVIDDFFTLEAALRG